MSEVQTLFKRHFGHSPTHVVRSPAGLEILGTSEAIPEGLTLALAVDKYVSIASAPRKDGRVELILPDAPGPARFWLSHLEPELKNRRLNLLTSVLRELKKRGVHFTGFNIAMHCGIPDAPCLDADASTETAIALTVRGLQPFTLTATGVTTPPQPDSTGRTPAPKGAELNHLAAACQAAALERGADSSRLATRLTALHGRAWNLVSIDSQRGSIEHIPLPGVAIVLCQPTATISKVGEPLLPLDVVCSSVAAKLRVKSLRSVEARSLVEQKSSLTDEEFRAASHVLGDIQRVVFAERALREDDHEQFGQYLLQSHESAVERALQRDEPSELLVTLARATPGCLGSRAFTGGPATLNLVAHHAVPVFTESITRRFQHKTATELKTWLCLPVEGAQ